MFQFSTEYSVKNGQLDGGITLKTLEDYGDFGIGAFDSFEGELVALDGKFFHCVGGVCTLAQKDKLLALAALISFKEEITKSLENLPYTTLKSNNVDGYSFNRLSAIKIWGKFEQLNIVCVGKQPKPYPPIEEIAKSARFLPYSNVTGSIVGWFTPDYMGGIRYPGFHLHFVSSDGSIGGHVTDFLLANGNISIMEAPSFQIQFYDKLTLKEEALF